MTALWTPTAFANPTAAQLATLPPLFAQKAADQNVTSNASFQNDNTLFVSVAANVKYAFVLKLLIKASSGTNGGMNVQFTVPSGTTGLSTAVWRWGGNTSPGQTTNASGGVTGLTLTTSPVFYGTEGVLITGANAGTFQFQWCQSGSNAASSTVMAESFLLLQQVA